MTWLHVGQLTVLWDIGVELVPFRVGVTTNRVPITLLKHCMENPLILQLN